MANLVVFSGTLAGKPEMKSFDGAEGTVPFAILRVNGESGFGERAAKTAIEAACYGDRNVAVVRDLREGDEVLLEGQLKGKEREGKNGTFVSLQLSVSRVTASRQGGNAPAPRRQASAYEDPPF